MTSVVSGSSYLILARSNGINLVAVKNTAGTVSLVNYNSSTYQDSECLWIATENVGGWTFRNNTYYISTNSSSQIVASTTASGIWTVNSTTGVMAFSGYTFATYTGSAFQMTTNSALQAPKLYSYSSTGGYTLTPTSSAGSNRVLVFNNGSNYWVLNIATSFFNFAFPIPILSNSII